MLAGAQMQRPADHLRSPSTAPSSYLPCGLQIAHLAFDLHQSPPPWVVGSRRGSLRLRQQRTQRFGGGLRSTCRHAQSRLHTSLY